MAKRVNRDDIDKFHDYSLHIPSRTIYMGSESFSDDGSEGGVDGLMAERLIKNMNILDSASHEPITIIMNNTGGDYYHGFAIYDAIKCCESEVTIKVFGHAMSMGSIILQAADKRLMSPNSRQMIHYGYLGVDGHAKTVQKWAKESLNLEVWTEKLYLSKIKEKHPEFTLEQLKILLDHDTFLTAEKSVQMGLADAVLPKKEKK